MYVSNDTRGSIGDSEHIGRRDTKWTPHLKREQASRSSGAHQLARFYICTSGTPSNKKPGSA